MKYPSRITAQGRDTGLFGCRCAGCHLYSNASTGSND
jgi:hypothetical protein